MYLPWLVFWSPQYHFPFSGAVAQQIEPTLGAFFNAIPADAGDKDVERRAFDIASYGKQLGWLTEVVLGAAGKGEVDAKAMSDAFDSLVKTHAKVEALKEAKRQSEMDRMMLTLEEMRLKRPAAYEALALRFEAHRKGQGDQGQAET